MLEPAVLAHVEATSSIGPITRDPSEHRLSATREIDRIFNLFGLQGPPVERITDHVIPAKGGAIRVRSYHPVDSAGSPAHVYLHGGGWTSGSIDELVCDATARHRSVSAHCVTFLVEYRLAPEFPFPTAVHDVIAAIRWVRDHATTLGIDEHCITLGGSSAGANLAAAAVLADPRLELRALLLEVPALDLRSASELAIPSDVDASATRWIEPMRDDFRSALAAYLSDLDLGESPLATPLVADDLSMFPETYIFTAELDVLRPGAEQFAARLAATGVPVHIECYKGALHGSPILNAAWPTARRWHDDSLAILRHLNGCEANESN